MNIGSGKARGARWEEGKNESLSPLFPLPGVPGEFPNFPLPNLRTTSLRSKAARQTKEASAEEREAKVKAGREKLFALSFLQPNLVRNHLAHRVFARLVGELCKLV